MLIKSLSLAIGYVLLSWPDDPGSKMVKFLAVSRVAIGKPAGLDPTLQHRTGTIATAKSSAEATKDQKVNQPSCHNGV